MSQLPDPKPGSIIYDDEKLYVCLATYPKVRGHTIVVWKEDKEDLHLLSKDEYEYLMDKVDEIRNALLKVLDLEKVYLVYMDEIGQVHWHLLPRYGEKGFDVFEHEPEERENFPLADEISNYLSEEEM